MHGLLLMSFLTQAPLATDGPLPGTTPWVRRNLMSVDWLAYQGPVVRVEGRTLRVQDDDFARSFELVPEAQALARSARASYEKGSGVLTASTLLLAGGATVLVVGTLLGPLVNASSTGQWLPTAITMGSGLVTMLSALVLTFVSLPHLQRAQNDFFGAIAAFNRGLLDVRGPVVVEPDPVR